MDETGVHTSAKRPPRVLSTKGKRQVGVITSAERQLTTIIGCVNAAGTYLPPCFISGNRKNITDKLLKGAPDQSVAWCSQSGWINNDIFLKWFKFFIERTRPILEAPVLLILDNHSAHINLDAINIAKEKGVYMVTVPPHTTHKLQPLDVSIYKPFKNAFEKAVDTFQKNPKNVGKRIGQNEVATLVNEAFSASNSVQVAVKGFKKCGVHPFNRNIFTASFS